MPAHAAADIPSHELEDSARIEALTSSTDITEETIEVYTNGACWYLAWWMHQLSGLPITTIGGYDGEILDALDHDPQQWDAYRWTHLGVIIENGADDPDAKFLDITGPTPIHDAMEQWLDDEGEEQGCYNIDDLDEFVRVVTYDPAKMTEEAATATRAIAELVLTRAGVPLLPSAAA